MSAPGNKRRLEGSDRDDWRTPDKLFSRLLERYEFDLDVCASGSNLGLPYLAGPCRCEEAPRCGLCSNWKTYGSRAFMNPPYSQVKRWAKKAASEHIDLVVALLPNATDAAWFTRLVVPTASEVIFLEGRVQFDEPPAVKAEREAAGKKKNGNTGGNILAVWRRDSMGVGYPRFSVWDWDA